MAEIPALPKRLKVTLIYLHIITASHFLLGLAVLISGAYRFLGESIAAFMIIAIFGVMLIVIGIGFEIINTGLKELNYWAWITGLIVCAIHLMAAIIILLTLGTWGALGSFIFFLLGIIGLSGLIVKDTRTAFYENRFVRDDIDEIKVI